MQQDAVGKWKHKKAVETFDAIIVGAGVSGMGVAALLSKAGSKVLLLERSPSVGGKLRSVEIDGITFDIGPHALQDQGNFGKLIGHLGKDKALKELQVPFIEKDVKMAAYKDGQWVDLY